jgi:hypothetical protein
MKNLGKILLLLLVTSHVMLFAGVKASLEQSTISMGDTATLNLSISGKDIKRPQILKLCDTDVVATGSRTNIEMVNGNYNRSYVLSYQFVPQKDCEIQPIEVEVDGVIQKSSSVSLKVKPVDRSQDSDFILSLSSDKKEVLVGEPFEATLLFKQKSGAQAVDSKYIAPDLKGFWNKNESKPIQYKDGDYAVTKVIYTLSAQRVGELEISPAKIQIASRSNTRDMFGMWMQNLNWKTYFSNELKVTVKPLPEGVFLVGDFTISASADKNEINPNEALNVVVKVKGEGNLEDIKTLKPYVDNVSVFDEKIAIQNSELSQKMAFVADADFSVPPFSIKYFDLKTKEVKTIATEEIKVKVNGAKAKKELTIKRQESEDTATQALESTKTAISYSWLLIAFAAGLAGGILIMMLKPWKFFAKDKSVNIKDPKILLMKLLPFKSDEEVQKIVDILEKNIYLNEKIEIDKKVLKMILKKYSIS